jgi:outer membrane protein assembly factor BamD
MYRLYIFALLVTLLSANQTNAGWLDNALRHLTEQEDGSQPNWAASLFGDASAADMLQRAQALHKAGKTSAAKRLYKKLTKRFPLASESGEAFFAWAQIEISREHWIRGFDRLQTIVNEHPDFDQFGDVIRLQFDCASALQNGARSQLLWVIPGFKQYGKAIEQYELLVKNAPFSQYAPLALMNIALIAELRKDSDLAIDALDRLINDYPQSMLAPDAYYNLAETYASLVNGSEYDQGATREAIRYFEDFLILFPKNQYATKVEQRIDEMQILEAKSRFQLGEFFYLYRSNATAALVFYNETLSLAPNSDLAKQAESRIAAINEGIRADTAASFVRRLLFIQ